MRTPEGTLRIVAIVLLAVGTMLPALPVNAQPSPGDLLVSGLAWTPGNPPADRPLTISAKIENEGGAVHRPFSVRFIVDNGTVIDEQVVDGLGAGANVSLASALWAPTLGLHRIRVLADADDKVHESNETNNEAAGSFYADRPELVPVDLFAYPNPAVTGSTTRIYASVENRGGADSGPIHVRFFIDGVAFGPDRLYGVGPRYTQLYVTELWNVTEGPHTVRVAVDLLDEVTEWDESNNEYAETFNGNESAPDLVVEDLLWTEGATRPGGNATFGAKVTNRGTAAAPLFAVRFLLDGQFQSERIVNGIQPGQTVNVTSLPWNATHGDHAIEAIADVHNGVPETDEANNARAESFHTGLADLHMLDVNPTSTPRPGEPVTFLATLRNDGDAWPTFFQVRFFVDGQLLPHDGSSMAMAPGITAFSTSLPWTATPGTHVVRAVADLDDVAEEWDETNNEVTRAFRVDGYDVDLSPQEQNGTALPGQQIQYTITVENTGTFNDTILLDHSPPPEGWKASLDMRAVALAPGQKANVTLTVTASLVPGSIAVIDVQGRSSGDSSRTDLVTTRTRVLF